MVLFSQHMQQLCTHSSHNLVIVFLCLQVVVICGRPQAVQAAEGAIKKLIEEKLRGGESESVTVTIPQFAVGRIIGRQGANIRSLQRESGARVSVERGGEEGPERSCVVTGTREEITRAMALLKESIQQSEISHRRQALKKRQQGHGVMEGDGHPRLGTVKLPDTGNYFPAFVSAVDGGGCVWIQPLEGEDPARLDSLVADMTDDYSKVSHQVVVYKTIQ